MALVFAIDEFGSKLVRASAGFSSAGQNGENLTDIYQSSLGL